MGAGRIGFLTSCPPQSLAYTCLLRKEVDDSSSSSKEMLRSMSLLPSWPASNGCLKQFQTLIRLKQLQTLIRRREAFLSPTPGRNAVLPVSPRPTGRCSHPVYQSTGRQVRPVRKAEERSRTSLGSPPLRCRHRRRPGGTAFTTTPFLTLQEGLVAGPARMASLSASPGGYAANAHHAKMRSKAAGGEQALSAANARLYHCCQPNLTLSAPPAVQILLRQRARVSSGVADLHAEPSWLRPAGRRMLPSRAASCRVKRH